jgi:hypothetical protein
MDDIIFHRSDRSVVTVVEDYRAWNQCHKGAQLQ